MSSRHISMRIDADTFRHLESRSRQLGQTRTHLVQTLLDEGLRMEDHPGIVFRSGPVGRRPGLAGGPDVWEVARVLREIEAPGNQAVHEAANRTGLAREQVSTALRYYAQYRDEIDDWIERVDEEATRAEAAWQTQQDLLNG